MSLVVPNRRRRRLIAVAMLAVGAASLVIGALLAVGVIASEDGGIGRTLVGAGGVGGGVLYLWMAHRSWHSRDAWQVEREAIVHTDDRGRTQRWPTESIATAHLYTVIVARYPHPRLALRDRSGAIVADVLLDHTYPLDDLERAFLDVGVGVTRERGVAPADVTDRRPGGDAVRVVSPRRATYVVLLFGSMLVPVVPVVLGVALGASDSVLGALLLGAVVGAYVAILLVVRRTKALTLTSTEVHLGAGHQLPPGIPLVDVAGLEVLARPVGSLVRIHLRDGRTLDHRLLGVPPSGVRQAALEAGVAVL
jgi:hypothetical protein